MEIIEKAAPFVQSSRIRLWMFFQDKNQIMTCYPQAESLLANSRLQIYFKPNDMKTAREISKRLGDTDTLFEGKKLAVTPQELMGPEYAEKQIIFTSGVKPLLVDLQYFYKHKGVQGMCSDKPYYEQFPDHE